MTDGSTYSRYWDRYVAEDLGAVQAGRDDLEWPGDEWGTPELWEQYYRSMFVQLGGAETWSRAVEIGQGSGKYTVKVLQNPNVSVRAYDVSASFLDVCRERCHEDVESGRLSLHQIDTSGPGYLLADLTACGWRREVDAVYSIAAMVHVDLQYLMAYLVTAAAVLRPGGKLILSLATAATDGGFQKLLEDIHNFWDAQADPGGSSKYEWLSGTMVQSLLPRLGFEIDRLLEPPGSIALGVVASLQRPEAGDYLCRSLASAQPESPSAAVPGRGQSAYQTYWDQYVTEEWQSARPGRADLEWPGDEWGNQLTWEKFYTVLFARTGGVASWKRAVEIGQGSGKYTLKVLANPGIAVRAYDVSGRFLDVCRERCRDHVEAGRLTLHHLDSADPGHLLDDLSAAGWRRQVDAVYSIDAMVHVDLQYLMAYLVTAAAVLRKGGRLILTLASVDTEAGFRKLVDDIPSYWYAQQQASGSGKFEWLNGSLIESLLPRLGFEIDRLWEPREHIGLSVVASLSRPEAGDDLQKYVSR